MPLPEPNSGEGQDEFISRCMSWMDDNDEGDSQEQRLAMCYSQWRRGQRSMDGERKLFKLSNLKFGDEPGTFSAVFATMNVEDHDGDVTLNGAFGSQNVILSQYNHGSWGSGAAALPIGVGTIFEKGDDAIISGEFNMDSEDAVKTYKTIKYLHDKGRTQEWSYALPEVEYDFADKDGHRVRLLKKIKVPEVSPVLMGAGINTRLLGIKQGKRLIDALKDVVEEVEVVTERVKTVREMREEEGRTLAKATTEEALKLVERLLSVVKELELVRPEPDEDHAMIEFLRFQKLLADRRNENAKHKIS